MEEAVWRDNAEKEAVSQYLDILKPESFYKDAHRKFQSCFRPLIEGISVDLYTVTEELRAHNELENAGGPVYLSQLTSRSFQQLMSTIMPDRWHRNTFQLSLSGFPLKFKPGF